MTGAANGVKAEQVGEVNVLVMALQGAIWPQQANALGIHQGTDVPSLQSITCIQS